MSDSTASTAPRIPGAFFGQRFWCRWKLDANRRKRPLNPDGSEGSTKNPAISRSQADAFAAGPVDSTRGVGIVLTGGVEIGGRRLVALDVDAAIRDGELVAWARALLEVMPPTFADVTPSGTGFRLWYLVADPPVWLGQSKCPIPAEYHAQPVDGKKPEVQPFGLSDGGAYVTFTGELLEGAEPEIKEVENLNPLLRFLGVSEEQLRREDRGKVDLPIGHGTVPTLDELEAKVRRETPADAIIDCVEWQRLLPKNADDTSASNGFVGAISHVLRAARGHGAVAAEFMVQRTLWATNEDSSEPERFGRLAWVKKRVAEVAQWPSSQTIDPADVFTPVERDQVSGPTRKVRAFAEVFESWRQRGPLVHEPTGIPWLDDQTRGGIPHGERIVIVGAPDAGKTLFLVELADSMMQRGVFVAFLAVDECPEDVTTRFVQRRGVTRDDVENLRGLDDVESELGKLPIGLYDHSWTIEAAAAHAREKAAGRPVLLAIDSLHAVTCAAEAGAQSVREAVTKRAQALRVVQQHPRMMVVATAEMNRAGYANARTAAEQNAVASGAESRALEFEARMLLRVTTVDAGVVEIVVGKNKLGGAVGAKTHLRVDRAAQRLVPLGADYVAPSAPSTVRKDAAQVALELVENPGANTRDLRAGVREKIGRCGKDRIDTAVSFLERVGALEQQKGERNSVRHFLVGEKVPADVLDLIPEERRADVQGSAPGGAEEHGQSQG